MIIPDCHIYYTLYNGGSHRSTWQHAYDLQPAMEWIFAQHKYAPDEALGKLKEVYGE